MDIERLLRKRQLNVQEQNAITAYQLTRTAKFWREAGVPLALLQYAEAKGVDWSQSIILALEVDFPGMPRLIGLLLTQTDRFIDFEIDTDASHLQIETVEAWEDVSARQNYSTTNPGTGKGFGAIAQQVRRELLAQMGSG